MSSTFTSFLACSATKNRASTFEDLTDLCYIHDFLTVIRSAKLFPAKRMPTKKSTGWAGSAGALHFLDSSRYLCGAVFGCEVGEESANTVWASSSPLKKRPVASSTVKPDMKRMNMSSIYIYMKAFKPSTECKDKQLVLSKRKGPINRNVLCPPNQPVQPPWGLWLFKSTVIIMNPFFAFYLSINSFLISPELPPFTPLSRTPPHSITRVLINHWMPAPA